MRKKLFAVIMSVMMMVTFMPAMAFAAGETDIDWAPDYTSVTWKDSAGESHSASVEDGSLIRKALNASYTDCTSLTQWDGMITAYVKGETLATTALKAKYYDLDYAYISKVGPTAGSEYTWAKSTSKVKYNTFSSYFTTTNTDGKLENLKLKFTVPSYVNNINKEVAGDYTVADLSKDFTSSELDTAADALVGPATADVEFYAMAPQYDEEKKLEDQTFTLSTTFKVGNANAGKFFLNSVKDRTLVVEAQKAKAAGATYTVDGKGAYSIGTGIVTDNIYYTGEDHAFAQSTMTGVTSTFKLYNNKTYKFEDVEGDSVKLRDVGTYKIRVTAKDADDTVTKDFTVEVKKTDIIPAIGFTKNDVKYYGSKYYGNVQADTHTFFVGNKFNPMDYFDVVAKDDTVTDSKKLAAFKKAVKADQDLFVAFFNDFKQITKEEGKFAKGTYTAEIETKDGLEDLTAAEKDALIEKYSTLVNNYYGIDLTRANLLGTDWFASRNITSEGNFAKATFVVEDDVTFSNAKLTKTYKAKNGKLAKTKHFTIKAKSLAGADVTYKMTNGGSMIKINRTTGKVTVKKGLKKGLRKVRVTAQSSLFDDAYDTYVLRIRVK